jgi:hypothetical protein
LSLAERCVMGVEPGSALDLTVRSGHDHGDPAPSGRRFLGGINV